MLNLEYKTPPFPALPPKNNVIICRGVPWGSDYNDSINFSDATAQLSYFVGKQKYNESALSPISLQKPLRISHVSDDLYDCNYLVLQNLTFTTKTLYAFIDRVEYVNPGSCNVYFTLDNIQSFLFDFKLGQCIVEREHVSSDKIGEHIMDEGIQLTEYVCQNVQRSNINDEVGIRVTYKSKEIMKGELKDRIYCGLMMQITPGEVTDAVDQIVNAQRETPDDIVSIQMVPYKFYNTDSHVNSKRLNFTYDMDGTKQLDGYTPKNNKLYTYPYNFLYVDNAQGQARSYRFENWEGNPYFTLYGSIMSGADITIVCTPARFYEGWNTGQDISQTLTLSGYPLCSWVSDTYRAYVAQNNNKYMSALGQIGISSLTSMALSPSPGTKLMALADAAKKGIDTFFTMQNAKIMPDKIHGNEGSNTYWSYDMMDFYFAQRCVKADIAKTIDDRFSRYGYRISKLKTPQYTSRKSWNFIKTEGCVVTGNLPWDVKDKIQEIFDHGITFWHGDYVGDYNRDNSIV